MASELVPLALAIALSPFPVVPVILLLLTPHPRSTSGSFLAGWTGGILTATTVFVLVAEVVETRAEDPVWLAWGRIALGIALLALGVRQWIGRHADKPTPAWLESVQTAGPAKALVLGFMLSAVNPKVVLLAAAAGIVIGSSGASATTVVWTVLVFALAASISVALPIVVFLVRGDAVLGALARTRDWLIDHNAAVMAVVIFAIGLMLTIKGIRGL